MIKPLNKSHETPISEQKTHLSTLIVNPISDFSVIPTFQLVTIISFILLQMLPIIFIGYHTNWSFPFTYFDLFGFHLDYWIVVETFLVSTHLAFYYLLRRDAIYRFNNPDLYEKSLHYEKS